MKVDIREPEKIFKYLKAQGTPYEEATLAAGDFETENVLIERKSTEDFIQSFRSGHLQDQLQRMQETGKICFLIISGNFDDIHFNPHIQLTVPQKLGMLASVASRYNVKLVQVSNDKQLCEIIPKLIEKSTDQKLTFQTNSAPAEASTYVRMLMCIPGIGYKKAKAIAEKYSSLRVVQSYLEVGSFKVEGIGPKLQKEIITALSPSA